MQQQISYKLCVTSTCKQAAWNRSNKFMTIFISGGAQRLSVNLQRMFLGALSLGWSRLAVKVINC